MKNKALSFLLSLSMILALIPAVTISASALPAADTNWEICNGTSQYAQFDTFAEAMAAPNDDESEANPTIVELHLPLVTENIEIPDGRHITIDLNGGVLKGTGTDSVIINNGTLTITDSNPTELHYFSVGADGLWTLLDGTPEADYSFGAANGLMKGGAASVDIPAEGSIIEISGGCITGGSGNEVSGIKRGGAVYVINAVGSTTLEGGNIVGNSADRGGGVYAYTFNMLGGTICGNTATDGGGNYGGTSNEFSMQGGRIAYNTATGNGGAFYNSNISNIGSGEICGNKAQNGGGVYNNNEFNISGGNICGNIAENGGGIYNANPTNSFTPRITMYGGTISGNTAVTGGGILLPEMTYVVGCFIEGTRITLPGGNTKNIENIAEGDYVKSFNHETGLYENNKVILAYESEEEAAYFTLIFEDGTELSISGAHELFEKSSLRYVSVSQENCESYVGKFFYNAASESWEKLVAVSCSSDKKKYYSLYVAKTVNCIAGGMLSAPDDIAIIDIYKYNPDLTVNSAALQADIDKYGIREFEDCALIKTYEEYEALNGRYYDILIGKGLATEEEIEEAYYDWYEASDAFSSVASISVPLTLMSYGPMLASTSSPMLAMTSEPLLSSAPLTTSSSGPCTPITLGGSAKITGNNGGNLFMENNIIANVAADANAPSTMTVGVTLAGGLGTVTSTCSETAKPFFFSDNIAYLEDFVSDHLELIAAAPAPTTIYYEPDPVITVPVSGDKDTVKVQATVSGTNATVKNITAEEISQIGTASNVVMNLSSLSDYVSGITIPKESFENIANSDAAGLEIIMPDGTVIVFDKTVLAAIAAQADGNTIKLVIDRDTKAEQSMTQAQKETIGEMNKPVVLDAYFTSNGTRISDFRGGEAEITAEYETGCPVRVWYVADDGEKTEVQSSYDGKTAKFIVTHFSHYVVEMLDGSNCKSCPQDESCAYAKFIDLSTTAWYHDGVHFCVENGYMNGFGKSIFGPKKSLNRGMVVQILYNMEGCPRVFHSSSFSDVSEDNAYADAIAWAEENKVVDGYGNGKFGPKNKITRQQLAQILFNYAKFKGYDVTASADLSGYTDAGNIGKYAVDAMKWANASGIVNGYSNGTLRPRAKASRAVTAAMIMSFCECIVK